MRLLNDISCHLGLHDLTYFSHIENHLLRILACIDIRTTNGFGTCNNAHACRTVSRDPHKDCSLYDKWKILLVEKGAKKLRKTCHKILLPNKMLTWNLKWFFWSFSIKHRMLWEEINIPISWDFQIFQGLVICAKNNQIFDFQTSNSYILYPDSLYEKIWVLV